MTTGRISTGSIGKFGFVAAGGLALAVIAIAAVMHWREVNDTAITAIALNPEDPEQARVGALIYRGGLDIPRMGQNIGGLSALRWDAASGRLLALTDDARWVWITPKEENGRLVGLGDLEVGNLLGLDGEGLSGKEQGDSESLTRSVEGGWLVGFERDHRVWRYPQLGAVPQPIAIDPAVIMGPLEPNGGTETLAMNESDLFLCAERFLPPPEPNCFRQSPGEAPTALRMGPPAEMRGIGAVATDADRAEDGTLFVLFRSYNPSRGNIGGITAMRPDGSFEAMATLRSPMNVDNFEGLALRQESGKTFLYIVSDDNFSSNQRTLLMKFELLRPFE